MPLVAIVTLVGVALIVGALAIYLTTIVFLLKRVSFRLDTIIIGVKAIAYQSQPLEGLIGQVAEHVAAMEQDVRRLPLPGARRVRG